MIALSICQSITLGANIDVSVEVPPIIDDPTNLEATPGIGIVDLTWVKSTSPNLTDQIVSVSDNGGLTYFLSESVGIVEDHRVTGLSCSITYRFKVVSVDHIGRQSAPGATVDEKPFCRSNPPPPPPPPPPSSYCGDGTVDSGEECDDGNTQSGDGCSSSCLIETTPGCGNGVLEGIEECDDGNIINGDGCSSLCKFEKLQSVIEQPDPDVLAVSGIDLTFTVGDPNNVFDYVRVYYSRDGGVYTQYPGVFRGSPIQLLDLEEGYYTVYSIAVSINGVEEDAPATEDAHFTINMIPSITLTAHPEKRFPATGNWGLDGNLKLYLTSQTFVAYDYDSETNDAGIVTFDNTINTARYHSAFKGRSHLTKFLRDVQFNIDEDIDLDFTFGDTFNLLAGDVHESKDDYVNGLDLSATVVVLYDSDEDADLNKDGMVNGLDLSIEVVNLYKSGEEL